MPDSLLLHFEPLPERAYMAASDGLVRQGYDRNAILTDYPFSGGPDGALKVNALAFAHPEHRNPADYAGFTVFNAANGRSAGDLVRILARSYAPFHLVHRDRSFSFWGSTVNSNSQVEPIEVQGDISYDSLGPVLDGYGADLAPQKVVGVKKGWDTFRSAAFRDIHPLQLSLWALGVTRKSLIEHFSHVVNVLRSDLSADSHSDLDETVMALAIQLLGACILAETGALGTDMRADNVGMMPLIRHAASQFERYFQQDLFVRCERAAERAYRLMRDVSYASFTPDMLTHLVKAACTPAERKAHGRYDTPLYLTRRIWENIPVEFLPPHRRVVADMTCGWGSFLIAGYERLSVLSDSDEDVTRQSLVGNEESPFTARVAGLGLLLSTSVDHWNIQAFDAVTWPWLRQHRPDIIVGNPPFGGSRETPRSGATSREEKANDFLTLAIDRLAPGGYLAMIMPLSFVAAEASPLARMKLLGDCDVTEVWEIPEGVFEGPTVRAIVLFAQKKNTPAEPVHSGVKVRTIQKRTLPEFQIHGVFTASQIADQRSLWNQGYRRGGSRNTNVLDYKIILPDANWTKLKDQCQDLSDIAVISRGATVGTPEKSAARRPRAVPMEPRAVDVLQKFHTAIPRDYIINYGAAQTKIYPTDFEEPRLNERELVLGAKVVLARIARPGLGKRIKLAIERRGYCVAHSFWGMAPKRGVEHGSISLEVLAAVMGWYVANAWIIEHLKSAFITSHSLATVPFPTVLSDQECIDLTRAVRAFEAAAAADRPEPAEARAEVDRILRRAYHLDDWTYERLKTIYHWATEDVFTLDSPPDTGIATHPIGGIVHGVDLEAGTIALWLDGFDSPRTVPITAVMPGWLLRPDIAFRTHLPRSCIWERNLDGAVWGRFTPQAYMYLTEAELVDGIGEILQSDGGTP